MSYIVGSPLFRLFSPRNQRSGSGNYSCSSCHLYSSNKLVGFYFCTLNYYLRKSRWSWLSIEINPFGNFECCNLPIRNGSTFVRKCLKNREPHLAEHLVDLLLDNAYRLSCRKTTKNRWWICSTAITCCLRFYYFCYRSQWRRIYHWILKKNVSNFAFSNIEIRVDSEQFTTL